MDKVQIIGYTQSNKPVYQPSQNGSKLNHSNGKTTKANYSRFSIQDHIDTLFILKQSCENYKDILRGVVSKELHRKHLQKPDKQTCITGWGCSVKAFHKDDFEGKYIYNIVQKYPEIISKIDGVTMIEFYHENSIIQKRKLLSKIACFDH